MTSYYGEPVLAPHVWTWEISAYFFVGGLAGASAPLSVLASLAGNAPLARRASAAALAGALISPPLLIDDLGRPERFFNMLRVLKVTSPMSVGSWLLSGFGASAAAGFARECLGVLPRAARAPQLAGVVLGPALSTYTAALVATTSVPAWHEARRELPFLFASSSAMTAGALAAVTTPVREAGPARAMAVAGGAAELALSFAMERGLGELGEPYSKGRSGTMAKLAKAATAAGTVGMALAGRRRAGAALAGAALLAGGALTRFAVVEAGKASALDPKYTVGPQRKRLDARKQAEVRATP